MEASRTQGTRGGRATIPGDPSIAQLNRSINALSQRSRQLAASNRALRLEVVQRKAAERSLRAGEGQQREMLKQSEHMQGQLRRLSRLLLTAQEDERRRISRELHDVIAQTLTGINLRLAGLRAESGINSRRLVRNIAGTQRLVEKSVNRVHQFARELRPSVLDDIGLVPALRVFMDAFAARTGLRTRLSASPAVDSLGMDQRTILFRVAQEALANVARHAHAGSVQVSIRRSADRLGLRIHDDGRSFDVPRMLHGNQGKRLGLLGMRERMEMVGGSFDITSAPGQGTTIMAWMPLAPPSGKGRR